MKNLPDFTILLCNSICISFNHNRFTIKIQLTSNFEMKIQMEKIRFRCLSWSDLLQLILQWLFLESWRKGREEKLRQSIKRDIVDWLRINDDLKCNKASKEHLIKTFLEKKFSESSLKFEVYQHKSIKVELSKMHNDKRCLQYEIDILIERFR